MLLVVHKVAGHLSLSLGNFFAFLSIPLSGLENFVNIRKPRTFLLKTCMYSLFATLDLESNEGLAILHSFLFLWNN